MSGYIYSLQYRISYDYGGDTGPCTWLEFASPDRLTAKELEAEIDKLGTQIRANADRMLP